MLPIACLFVQVFVPAALKFETGAKTMNRIDRLFGILTFLQSKKYVTAEAIAARFHISIRTVYRDIKALCEQGIPVSHEQYKGYFLVQGYFIPPVSFTSEEANALLLMETMVNGFADRSISRHYTSALTKIKAVLRPQQKEKLEVLTRNMHFHLPECFENRFEYLSHLQQAISTQTILEIDYKNKNLQVSKRLVEPIGLVFYAFGWHIIGWCHLRKAYRDFKVTRMLAVRNTNQSFTIKNPITLEQYLLEVKKSAAAETACHRAVSEPHFL